MQNDPDPDLVGRRIQIARRLVGFNQETLGAALGVSAKTVHRWETGKTEPSLATLVAIAKITGKRVAWFVEGDVAAV